MLYVRTREIAQIIGCPGIVSRTCVERKRDRMAPRCSCNDMRAHAHTRVMARDFFYARHVQRQAVSGGCLWFGVTRQFRWRWTSHETFSLRSFPRRKYTDGARQSAGSSRQLRANLFRLPRQFDD